MTTRDRLVGDAEPLLRMVREIQRTQQWIYSRSAPEIAETLVLGGFIRRPTAYAARVDNRLALQVLTE